MVMNSMIHSFLKQSELQSARVQATEAKARAFEAKAQVAKSKVTEFQTRLLKAVDCTRKWEVEAKSRGEHIDGMVKEVDEKKLFLLSV
uniref:Uncharacterized protein n=1 Tax=Nelumbo nucifera TaxID=4432 RepID=A0A822YY28_NELNU|nr:TPA_asm: hypothetical protein HUJ06_007754 [Nelumbo nucifera]